MVSAARRRPPAPARVDAQRNHERVLDAADALFTAEGATASTGHVAARAGVGVGTVYRHFPTKAALLDAVVARRLDRLASEAERLAAVDDAGAAFDRFFRKVGLWAATGELLAEAFTGEGSGVDGSRARFERAVEALLARAQAAGAIRGDVLAADVLALFAGATRVAVPAGRPADDGRDPALPLDVMLQGLRPPPA